MTIPYGKSTLERPLRPEEFVMAVQDKAGIEAVRLLLDVRKRDALYGDRHLARAAELLLPHLDPDAYRGLSQSEAAAAEDFEQRMPRNDLQGGLIRSLLNPINWFRLI